MPKTPELTDDQVKQLMLENPQMGQREFCGKYRVGQHRWTKIRKAVEIELANKRDLLDPDSPTLKNRNKWVYDRDYVYNAETDTYVTFLRCAPKPIVVDGETHRAMQRAYSSWDGNPATINEICRSFSFPRPWFVEYKARHGWTHDKEPFTNEEVLNRDSDEMVEEALEARRNVLFQKYEQRKWQATKEDADKWRALQKDLVLPFSAALSLWKPPKPFLLPRGTDAEKFSLVVTASDWHIGLKAIEENLTLGGNWDAQIGIQVIHNYLEQIYKDVQRLKVNWGPCYLLNLGDLPHGLRGKTEFGTLLVTDVVKRQQYDAVFSLLTYFIEGLYRIFGNVEEVGVAGNHEGFDWYAIARALQERYRGHEGIQISATTKMVVYKKIGRTLFIITHGKNPFGYKFKYAVNDSDKRHGQLQAEIIRVLRELGREDAELMKDLIQIAFISGENHFYKQIEKGQYEDLQFGTAARGDDFAEVNRLTSRPSQSCLLVSYEHGIKAPLRYYLDELQAKAEAKSVSTEGST